MRIASCNLLHGIDIRVRPRGGVSGRAADDGPHIDLAAAAEWIASLDADVVALQEVDMRLERSGGIDQVAWLADRLGCEGVFAAALMGSPDHEWHEVPSVGLPPGVGGYGVGLLSRIGLGDVVRTRLPHGRAGTRRPGASPANPGVDTEPRVSLSATVGGDVRVSTTHLSYMFWRAVPQLGAALDAAADGHGGRGVFLGDVNLPSWGGRLALHGRGLNPWAWPAAATRAAGWRHLAGAPTYPSWKPRLQLDQVFLRHVDQPAALTVGAPGPSDHLPLIVHL